jgi:hypothetical protein
MVEHPSLPRTMMSRTRPLGRRAAGRGRGGRREWRGCGEAAAGAGGRASGATSFPRTAESAHRAAVKQNHDHRPPGRNMAGLARDWRDAREGGRMAREQRVMYSVDTGS